jgi:metacaspase-1
MPTGRALTVGVNVVDKVHYQNWPAQLKCAEFDARDVAAIAERAGCDTRTLLGADATRQRVLGALDAAATSSQPGDLFVFFYAGHGGQVPDLNGDEDDGLDETMCLFDGQLVDDELAVAWSRFQPGVRIFTCADSCHSGTLPRKLVVEAVARSGALRAILPDAPRDDEDPPLTRDMPLDVAGAVYEANQVFYDDIQARTAAGDGRRNEAAIQASVIHISACQDNQLSQEFGKNGIFTRVLKKVWKDGNFAGDYVQFSKQLVKESPAIQTPKLLLLGQPNPAFQAQRPFAI